MSFVCFACFLPGLESDRSIGIGPYDQRRPDTRAGHSIDPVRRPISYRTIRKLSSKSDRIANEALVTSNGMLRNPTRFAVGQYQEVERHKYFGLNAAFIAYKKNIYVKLGAPP